VALRIDVTTEYTIVLLLGIILSAFGFILWHWRERRRFIRMSSGGVEQFPSYSRMLGSRIIETMVLLVADVFMIAGIAVIGYWLFWDGGFKTVLSWFGKQ
jgi:hypothetical protein